MMLGVAFGGLSSILSGANLLKVGLMAASAVGMYLLNGKKEKGEIARLDDLKVSSSSYGRGIPIVYGTMRVTGNMFWATDFEERLRYTDPKEKGGKLGEKKGVPYYEYHANFAMMLCEGPVEELLRVWADSNLIYDKHNPDNEDIVHVGFSRPEDSGGKTGFGLSKKKGGDGGSSGRFTFRYYSGTETQLQDPFMVQKQGADMVPAFRGRAYLFFQRFKLEDFGNRIPTITAEVATKKKETLHFRTMDNMGPPESNTAIGSVTYLDPERYRLYHTETSAASGNMLRIWDLSQNREIRRITANEINEINGWSDNIGEIGISSMHNFLGIAGNGDLVFPLTTGNSAMIGFLDPNTFLATTTFGFRSNRLSNTSVSIVAPRSAVPFSYIDVKLKIFEQEVELTPKRATLITSYGGEFYVFGEDNEPLSFFGLGLGTGANISIPVQTKVDLFGGEFYFTMENTTSSIARLFRITWNLFLSEETFVADGRSWPVYGGNHRTNVNARVMRELNLGGGSQSVKISNPQVMPATEEVVWFESLLANDDLTRGTWVAAYPLMERNPQELSWHKKISDQFGVSPDSRAMNHLPVNIGSSIKWISGSTLWDVDVRAREVRSTNLGNQLNQASGLANRQMWWPARNAIVGQFLDPTADGERKWAMILLDRNEQVPVDVHFIISDLAERVGLPPDKVDLTRLDVNEIIGYVIENPSSARGVVEELASMFMFDVAEVDYTLKAVSRGQEITVTIPQRHLGVVDQETHDYYIEERVQEIDLPQTVVVNYINPDKDYQVNNQHYRRPRSPMPVMHTRDKLELNLPMAMRKNTAKQLAHKVTMSLWTERINYNTLLPWNYLRYDPTDVFEYVMDDGLTFTARQMAMDLGANFAIESRGVSQTPAAYTSDAEGSPDGGVIPIPTTWPPQTQAHVINVPYLDDSDVVGQSRFLYYWGAAAFGPGLRGAAVEYRLTGISEWKLVGLTEQELVWGRVPNPVPPPPWGNWATDDVNVIELIPAHPYEDESGFVYTWESIAPEHWPSTDNCIVIGEEVIYFRDVELLDTGAVRISHLIRGARGTENAAYKHEGLERFVVRTNGLKQREESIGFRNQEFMFRSFSTYSILPPFRYDITLTAATLKPWAPSRFRRSVSGSNIVINWERRTRFGGQMADGTGNVPLNEEAQLYDVFFLFEPYDPETFDSEDENIVMRSYLERTAPNVTYTSAQMSEDSFDPADPLHVVIFQLSGQIGRGFPGYATLHPSILI